MKRHIGVLHAADIMHNNTVAEGVCKAGQFPDRTVLGVVSTEECGLTFYGVTHLVKADHIFQAQLQHITAGSLRPVEALIQHNESPIDTWSENEYELNKTYAFDTVAFSDWLLALRQSILEETLNKIAHEDGK